MRSFFAAVAGREEGMKGFAQEISGIRKK